MNIKSPIFAYGKHLYLPVCFPGCKSHPIKASSLTGKTLLLWHQMLLELTPTEKGDYKENGRVAPIMYQFISV